PAGPRGSGHSARAQRSGHGAQGVREAAAGGPGGGDRRQRGGAQHGRRPEGQQEEGGGPLGDARADAARPALGVDQPVRQGQPQGDGDDHRRQGRARGGGDGDRGDLPGG